MSDPTIERVSRSVRTVFVLLTVAALGWLPTKELLLHRFGRLELEVGRALVAQRLGLTEVSTEVERPSRNGPPPPIELAPGIVPYREIGAVLGERGRTNGMLVAGAAVFDANGDGRLDLYLSQDGRPVARATTEDGVLQDRPVAAWPSTLFLNQGNGPDGAPRLVAVQELVSRGNGELERAELLVENKLHPRSSAEEDELGPGRIAYGAVPADFNGDGRLDLYVLNAHRGQPFQSHELGLRAHLPVAGDVPGEREWVVVRPPSFLWTDRVDGLTVTVEAAGGPEPEGRNSLYLNLGDRDGDGIPEWRDVTEPTGTGGRWCSAAATVADYDRDGDLDLYVANFIDPDFWGFGALGFAGNRNQLYKNLLVETGELRFVDVAGELGVAGLHRDEHLPAGVWLPWLEQEVAMGEQRLGGRRVGEAADHSWAVLFNDFNEDGWPDLVVANDVASRLRVYVNEEGRGFRRLRAFDELRWDGCWMGFAAGDLDGDLHDEMFITNCGGQMMTARTHALLLGDGTRETLFGAILHNYPRGLSTLHNVLLSYRPGEGLVDVTRETRIDRSEHMAPDAAWEENFAPDELDFYHRAHFADALTAYEFGWNSPFFDVDNDGDLDIYFAGALGRGNDHLIGDASGNAGRLFVNESHTGRFRFTDRTLEYRLLDVTHMDYDSNPPVRAAPALGWSRGERVFVTDLDRTPWAGGPGRLRDLYRLHEAAMAVVAADLNRDGFDDLVVTHMAGYTSLDPEASALRVPFAGEILTVTAPLPAFNPPTRYEPGRTFIHLHGGAPRGGEDSAHWVRLRLLDPTTANRHGVGARVLINGNLKRRIQIGGVAFGGVTGDLTVGLGQERLKRVEIHWPSGNPEVQRVDLKDPVSERLVCIDRVLGRVGCES